MAEATYPVPTSMAAASAAQRAAAAFYLTRIEAIQSIMNGAAAIAFEEALVSAVEAGVPEGTSAATNIPSAAGWFQSIRDGLDADWASLNATANPPTSSMADEPKT